MDWSDLLPDMRGEVRALLGPLEAGMLALTCKREYEARDRAKYRSWAYELLRTLNPKGHVSQWVYDGYEDGVTKESLAFFDKLTEVHSEYTSWKSLIAKVKFAKGVVVYLTLSSDGAQLYKGVGWHGFHKAPLHLVTCQLDEVNTTDCRGDKCRRSMSYADNGLWCTACHGDPDISAVFGDLMPYEVSFADLPRKAILWADTRGSLALATKLRDDEVAALRRKLAPGGQFDQDLVGLNMRRVMAETRLEVLTFSTWK